jgi:hypothetical protein
VLPLSEVVVATGWECDQGSKVLTGLSVQQSCEGKELCGVDSCFLGAWVCGSHRFEKLRKRLEKLGYATKQLAASGTKYRFGQGASEAVNTWRVPVRVGVVDGYAVIDVIRGALPLLCGDVAISEFRLCIDGSSRQVLQRTETGFVVVNSYETGQLPSVDILPGRRTSGKKGFCVCRWIT